jgi:hypothetical protein
MSEQYNILLECSRFDFFPTRFLTEMVTKHLFEIAWNVCGTRRKSISSGDKVLGSLDFHSNSMNIIFFILHFFHIVIGVVFRN